jgi:hypothetical protein
MKIGTLSLILAASLLAPAAVVAYGAARITVLFEHPEKFTDVKDSFVGTDKGRDDLLGEIKQFIESRASSCMREDQCLEIKFTDIDLAGDFEPSHGPGFDRVRLMKGVYPPRLTFEFKLTDATGRVLSQGKRRLTDQTYQMRLLRPGSEDDSLRYEKDLLIDWMHEDLGSAKTTGR